MAELDRVTASRAPRVLPWVRAVRRAKAGVSARRRGVHHPVGDDRPRHHDRAAPTRAAATAGRAALLTGLAFLGAALFGPLSGRRRGAGWASRSASSAHSLEHSAWRPWLAAGSRTSPIVDVSGHGSDRTRAPLLSVRPAMFERDDAPAGHARGVRPSLVRWAVVTNLSSFITLALLSFAVFEEGARDRAHWELGLLAAALASGGVVRSPWAARPSVSLFAPVRCPGRGGAHGLDGAWRVSPRVRDAAFPGFGVSVVALAIAYSGPIWRFVGALSHDRRVPARTTGST